jgi:hypothetical protein
MPKELNRPRPASSISDMLDTGLIDQATTPATSAPQVIQPSQRDTAEQPSAGHQQPLAVARTGEPADIQRMYRLTPTAYKSLQQLRLVFSSHLGFDVAHSVVMRSILYAIERALPQIEQASAEQLLPCAQPSTAIGNELARDALEHQLTEAIVRSFLMHTRQLGK